MRIKLHPLSGHIAIIDIFDDLPKNNGLIDLTEHRQVWYFLDDEREPVEQADRHWVIFRTAESMVQMIAQHGLPAGISFDHDLGEDRMDGYDAARIIRDMVVYGPLELPRFFTYQIHSQNPVGEKNIHGAMNDMFKARTLGMVQ